MNNKKRKIIDIIRPICRGLWSILYFGNNFTCPICRGHFRKFLSYGDKQKRPDVLCPRCRSLERHRLLWMFLNDKTNIFKDNLKILHFAPEPVFQKIFRSVSNIDYVTTDLSSRLADVKMDITNTSFKDNSFDVILCIHVLEHVLKDQDAMRELFRILKYGGWAIIQSPIDVNYEKTFEDFNVISPEDRKCIFGHREHVRIYGCDYKMRLENAGFIVKEDKYIRSLETDIIRKYALIGPGGTDVYICTKRYIKEG